MSDDARTRLPHAVLAVFVTALLIGIGSILFTKDTQESSDQQWCVLLSIIVTRLRDPAYHPVDPAAVQYAQSVEALYVEFQCADVAPLGTPSTPLPSRSE